MSLHISPGNTGPALETVERECMAEGCTKTVKVEVWPGKRAPRMWCHACRTKMYHRESEQGSYV